MSGRPTLLVLTDYFQPGYRSGGPLRTLANFIARFGGSRYDVTVVTRDRDVGDSSPYPGIGAGLHEVGGARVLYLPPERQGLRSLRSVLASTPHDLLYLNSLFSPVFSIRPLLLRRARLVPLRPLLLAPRGELAPGAFAQRAPKKRSYLWAARRLGLHEGLLWHASSEFEAADIRRVFPGARVHVLPDWTPPLAPAFAGRRRRKEPGELAALFVSRVVPVKNLRGALGLLAGAAARVRLSVFGPLEDLEYARDCVRAAARLPESVQVEFHGPLPHDRVRPVMAEHDLLLLPSLGENFGHVVLEALGAGLPVLLSDRTPWRGLEAAGAGWELPVEDAEAFRARLRLAAAMGEEEHRGFRERAHAFARAFCARHEREEDTVALFARALAGPADA